MQKNLGPLINRGGPIVSDLRFEDLRLHCQTGRSYVISGEGRNRVYGYRTGVQCNLGDIERAEWIRLVTEVISREGEQELHQQLLQHLKDHNYIKESKAELAFKALEFHTARIFDNEAWVDYIRFNQKYRPEHLDASRLILVMPQCCAKAGYITRTRFDENQEASFCPHCGRWTQISLVEEDDDSSK